MHPLTRVLPAALLAVCLLGAAPALAGDDEEPKPAARVVWTFEKAGLTRDLDVTTMDAALRKALRVQMKDQGWVLREAPPPAPKKDAAGRDIEELIRRGGKLPEGWRPHGLGPVRPPAPAPPGRPLPRSARPAGGGLTKAAGKLILAYLAAKDDPARGPVYEAVLRDLGEALAADEGGTPLSALGRVVQRLMRGLRNPETAPVYGEILKILGEGLAAPGRLPNTAPAGRMRPRGAPPVAPTPPRPPAAPKAPAEWDGPRPGVPPNLGGAQVLYYVLADGGTRRIEAVMRRVPTGSTAYAAGLREGDRIVSVDGKPVDRSGLRRARRVFAEGGQLTLEVVRKDDTRETVSLLLEKE